MAMYHLHVNVISRAQGRSSIAAASYRSAERLIDRRQEMTFDFTRKQSVDYSQIMLPEQAPIEFENRETLWNAVEMSETRYNSRTAREVEIALPREFDLQTNVSLVQDFVQHQFVDRGMCADFSIHNAYRDNPHAHIMLTTREVDENGFTVKNRQWDKQEMLVEWRREWENEQNIALEREGHEMRVSSLTLEKQGIEREPSVHLGRDHKIEQQHKLYCERHEIEYEPITPKGQQLERIRHRNELRAQIKQLYEAGMKLRHEITHSMDGMSQKLNHFMERTREVRQQMQHKLDYQQELKQTLTQQHNRGFEYKYEAKHTQGQERRVEQLMERIKSPEFKREIEKQVFENLGQKQELRHTQEQKQQYSQSHEQEFKQAQEQTYNQKQDFKIEIEPAQQQKQKLTIDPAYEEARKVEHKEEIEQTITPVKNEQKQAQTLEIEPYEQQEQKKKIEANIEREEHAHELNDAQRRVQELLNQARLKINNKEEHKIEHTQQQQEQKIENTQSQSHEQEFKQAHEQTYNQKQDFKIEIEPAQQQKQKQELEIEQPTNEQKIDQRVENSLEQAKQLIEHTQQRWNIQDYEISWAREEMEHPSMDIDESIEYEQEYEYDQTQSLDDGLEMGM